MVSDQSHLSESGFGASSGAVGGSSNYESGNLSKKSSSKSSSSESNKNSRIKTGSTFGAGSQNIAANTYDASKASSKYFDEFKFIKLFKLLLKTI